MSYTTITQTTAVSTSPGASNVVGLNWLGGKPTTVSLSWNSSNVLCLSQLQYSLDDVQRTLSSRMAWNAVPSTVASSTPQIYASSTFYDTGVSVPFLSPIAAIRLFSTAITAGGSQAVYADILQSEGG
jgi:hypothetical protein